MNFDSSVPATGAIPVVPPAAPATGVIPIVDAYPAQYDLEYPAGQLPTRADLATGAISLPNLEAATFDAEHPPPLDTWQIAPNLRWSMRNIEEFLPVHPIARGKEVSEFSEKPKDLSGVMVNHPWEDRATTFREIMAMTETSGWLVTHRGAVVGEQYFGDFARERVHLLMSVSKSLTATLAGQLADAGLLDLDALVTDYVPELVGSGYDGARVRHLVDMRTGVKFSEEYLRDDSEVRLLEEALGWAPKRHKDVPDGLLAFLATLERSSEHGGPFDYKSCETDALGFVIEGATGRSAADIMAERLWQPMGAEYGAHVAIDSKGGGMFDGGVSGALRDLARFGHLFANNGRTTDGKQVLTEAWVDDTFEGEEDSAAAFAAAPEPTLMPGGMYRNGFWFPGRSRDVMLALGIHGQMIYINRATRVIGVKASHWPTPQDPEKLFWTLRAFDAASWALSSGTA